MTIRQFLRNSLLYTLIISLCFSAVPQRAQAANLDSFIAFLEQVEDKAGPAAQNMPFTSQQVKDVKVVIECLETSGNDVDVAVCIDEFHDTSVGQQAGSQAEIPSWVYDLLDSYIMYRTGDYWGLAWKLGEAVACVVIQILVGGTDVCGLIEELVKIAEGLWDAAKAVADFFTSVGGAAWDAAKGVGCSLGLGGCDDSPDTPPEIWVYNYIFDAKIADGLTARKALDGNAFNNLVNQLKANAAANPPIYSTPVPDQSFMELLREVIRKSCANTGAVDRAAKIFTATVNTQWTSDLGKNVLPLRSERFNQYNNPNKVNFLTLAALASFKPGETWDPRNTIVKSCEQEFVNGFGFAHIDRWLGMVNELGADAISLKPAVQSNDGLCTSFWELRKNDFAAAVYDHTEQQYCGAAGNTLMCSSIDQFRACVGLLTPFGDNDKCRINTRTAGKEAADKVLQEIKKLGTAFPVWSMFPPQAVMGVSSQPYALVGHRPTHQVYCQSIYAKYFGDIPQQLLKCSYRASSAYEKLVADVEKAVALINFDLAYPCTTPLYDPLAVVAGNAGTVTDLQEENKDFGFKAPSLKPGFDYSTLALKGTVDGLNTPLIFFDLKGAIEEALQRDKLKVPVQEKIPAMIDPLGPVSDKLSGLDERDQLEKTGDIQAKAVGPVAIKTFEQRALAVQQHNMAPQAIKTFDQQQAPAGQQQVMSATVPAGQVPSNGPSLLRTTNKIGVAKSATIMPTVSGLPDLQATATLEVNGHQVPWNTMLILDATSLKPALGGRCQVPTRLVVKNAGAAASAACQVSWPRPADLQAVASLASGKAQIIDKVLELPVGMHRLQLQLDTLQQVQESNKENNSANITLQLTGTCGGSLRPNMPAPLPTVPQNAPAGALSTKPGVLSPQNKVMINPQPEPPGAIQRNNIAPVLPPQR